jgi:hypothetical protein
MLKKQDKAFGLRVHGKLRPKPSLVRLDALGPPGKLHSFVPDPPPVTSILD